MKTLGPCPAELMIILDHASAKDELAGSLLSGPAGPELLRMIKEAGLEFDLIYVTSVLKFFPKKGQLESWIPKTKKGVKAEHSLWGEHYVSKEIIQGAQFLLQEIEQVKPKVIITMGEISTMLLTGKEGLKTYRGSILTYADSVVIPTYPPALIFQMWSLRAIAVQDLRRAKRALAEEGIRQPDYQFKIAPSSMEVLQTLARLQDKVEKEPTKLSVDIETRSGHITCIGLAWSKTEAICIPIVDAEKGSYPYFSQYDEAYIVFMLYHLLTHKNCLVITQNGNYDFTYIYKAWHFIPNHYQDTMVSAHTNFTTMQKSLDFLASMYASYYKQWKGEMRGQFKLEEKKDA